MVTFVLNDADSRINLSPFALTRNVSDIRIGILTIREKWQQILGPAIEINATSDLSLSHIPANFVPEIDSFDLALKNDFGTFSKLIAEKKIKGSFIIHPWDIFRMNGQAIQHDYEFITKGRQSSSIPPNNFVVNEKNIFIEETANITQAFLNASEGPIYIGKNVTIMDGACVRGPVAFCDGTVVKMGAKIYGGTTIGPNSIVGGEIKNSIIFGNSNKGHDGYLGDSVIGEWCNLGGGTSNSNFKNTAGEIKVWNDQLKSFQNAGTKCGLFMGDYSRCAINTSFYTGYVTGVCCNIFGGVLPSAYSPSFTWGVNGEKYVFEKAINDIGRWKELKKQKLTNTEIQTLKNIFDQI